MWFRVTLIALCLIACAGRPLPAIGQTEIVTAASDGGARADFQNDELVRQLQSTASRGGKYRAQAIRSLARIGAWSQADYWLAKIDSIADAQELAQSAEQIGNEILLRISLRTELSDASRSAIKKMSLASESYRQDPGRLRLAIAQLAEQDVDAILAADRILLSGGNAAIEEIVAALMTNVAASHSTRLLQVLGSFGDGGPRALDQLALYGDPGVRPAALEALLALDPDRARDTAISTARAVDATPAEVQVAEHCRAISETFGRLDAIAVLADRLETLRGHWLRTPNDESPATLWSVDESRSAVAPARSTQLYLLARDTYDAAQRLRRLGDLPPAVGRAVLSTDLSYRVLVDLNWGDETQLGDFRASYPEASNVGSLLTCLMEARRDADTPAALGIVRLLADLPRSDFGADSVLTSGGEAFSELVKAVQDPEPRIRFEAATSLIKHASDVPFAGSSQWRQTLAEMASLDPRPTALLLENRPVVALRQESILAQLGYSVRKVTSAIDAEREVQRGGDLSIVVSKIMIADAATAELVDRVRRQPKGSRVPIVLYSDLETNEKSLRQAELETVSNRWTGQNTPAVYQVALPGSPAAFAEILAETLSKRRVEPLSASERAYFRAIGADALQGNSLPR